MGKKNRLIRLNQLETYKFQNTIVKWIKEDRKIYDCYFLQHNLFWQTFRQTEMLPNAAAAVYHVYTATAISYWVFSCPFN